MVFGVFFVLLVSLWTSCVVSDDPCLTTPQSSNCSNYYYPDSESQSNTLALCSSMPSMSVCDFKTLCNTSTQDSGPFCQWFALYKEGCVEMAMGPCGDYMKLCAVNSTVPQCHMDVIHLPSNSEMQTNSTFMCKQMPGMTGCECTACTIIQKYGELCKEMQGGEKCYAWTQFCKKIPNWSICSNSPGDIVPIMKMYFHWDIYDYILFKSWIPYNALTYAISLICVFMISLIHEGYKVLKVNMEIRWKMSAKYESVSRSSSQINTKSHLSLVYAPFDWRRDILRAVYRTIDVAFHFFIMLIAMTFNAGLFIAVILGYGVGHLLFSRLSKPKLLNSGSLIDEEETCH